MRKPRLLLDVDGILADFVGATIRVMTSMSGMKIVPDDILVWEVTEVLEDRSMRERCKEEFNRAGFCSTFDVYDGAQDAVRQLQSSTELFFVTAPMKKNPTWMPDRVQWLEKHFGADSSHVVFASKKHVVAGDIMVDDAPSNISGWLPHNPGSSGLLWDRPYNRGDEARDLVRISTWGEVLSAVALRAG